MEHLSLIQRYMVCALDKNGRMESLSGSKERMWIAAGVMDLYDAGCLSPGKDKTLEAGEAPPKCPAHLKPLLEKIGERKRTFCGLLEAYLADLQREDYRRLWNAAGDSLAARRYVKARPGKKMNQYVPMSTEKRLVSEGARDALLGKKELSKHDSDLIILLCRGGVLGQYLSPFDQKQIRGIPEELEENADQMMKLVLAGDDEFQQKEALAVTMICTAD